MAHLDLAPIAPAAQSAVDPAPVAALQARLRRRAQELAHLAAALPDDLAPEQRLLVDRALDAQATATTQLLAAAGLVRRSAAPLVVVGEVLALGAARGGAEHDQQVAAEGGEVGESGAVHGPTLTPAEGSGELAAR